MSNGTRKPTFIFGLNCSEALGTYTKLVQSAAINQSRDNLEKIARLFRPSIVSTQSLGEHGAGSKPARLCDATRKVVTPSLNDCSRRIACLRFQRL